MVGIDGKGIYVSSGVKSILDFSPRTHLGPFFHLPAQWHTAHWKLEQLSQDKLLLFEETLQNNSRKMSKRRGECVIQPPSERWVRLQVTRGRAHVFPCCKRANGYRDSIWNFFKICTNSSIYPLVQVALSCHTMLLRLPSVRGPNSSRQPASQSGGIVVEGQKGMKGLGAGQRPSSSSSSAG